MEDLLSPDQIRAQETMTVAPKSSTEVIFPAGDIIINVDGQRFQCSSDVLRLVGTAFGEDIDATESRDHDTGKSLLIVHDYDANAFRILMLLAHHRPGMILHPVSNYNIYKLADIVDDYELYGFLKQNKHHLRLEQFWHSRFKDLDLQKQIVISWSFNRRHEFHTSWKALLRMLLDYTSDVEETEVISALPMPVYRVLTTPTPTLRNKMENLNVYEKLYDSMVRGGTEVTHKLCDNFRTDNLGRYIVAGQKDGAIGPHWLPNHRMATTRVSVTTENVWKWLRVWRKRLAFKECGCERGCMATVWADVDKVVGVTENELPEEILSHFYELQPSEKKRKRSGQ